MSRTRQRKGRVSGKRRRAGEMAVQMLYQQELGSSELEAVFSTFDLSDYVSETESDRPSEEREANRVRAEESFEHAKVLVRGTVQDGEQIDDLIREHAENWRLERMPAIDRNILRLAVYEMLHEQNVPKVVIVDEAIELAKKFGAESSGRFVNGLLDGVLKSARFKEPASRTKPRATVVDPQAAVVGEPTEGSPG